MQPAFAGTDVYGRAVFFNGYGYVLADGSPAPAQGAPAQQASPIPGMARAAPPVPSGATALVGPQSSADLAANGEGRFQFWPTSPRWFVGAFAIPRYYTQALVPTDTDYPAVGTEVLRPVRFDFPTTICAINGSAISTAAGNAFPIGVTPRNCWLLRVQYVTGEWLTVNAALAEDIVGSAERPGQLGAGGWLVEPASMISLGITPLIANIRISVTLHTLEQRGARNFSAAEGSKV